MIFRRENVESGVIPSPRKPYSGIPPNHRATTGEPGGDQKETASPTPIPTATDTIFPRARVLTAIIYHILTGLPLSRARFGGFVPAQEHGMMSLARKAGAGHGWKRGWPFARDHRGRSGARARVEKGVII